MINYIQYLKNEPSIEHRKNLTKHSEIFECLVMSFLFNTNGNTNAPIINNEVYRAIFVLSLVLTLPCLTSSFY